MLDSILNTVKKASERVQRRGEEVAQVARLRLEVFQLGRELDATYARLGRSYHGNAGAETLHGVRDEIRRIEEEITSRERLIAELGEDPKAPHTEGQQDLIAPVSPTPATGTPSTGPGTGTVNRPPFQDGGEGGSAGTAPSTGTGADSDARPDGTSS
ncbi:hypothetical protein [Deinococcus ficus]|uniref:hypothetical protein n=1 Tax=Deinococcus ficus TaxID=317577 RepID=UPI00174E4CBB|nr:hypothetical protein [Deinococcus ficus]GHF76205.1 hypothetical protein GCM10017782_12590 [Deinococcus ficus]